MKTRKGVKTLVTLQIHDIYTRIHRPKDSSEARMDEKPPAIWEATTADALTRVLDKRFFDPIDDVLFGMFVMPYLV